MTEAYVIAIILLITFISMVYFRRLRNIQVENIRLEEKIKKTRQFYSEVEGQVDRIRRYRHDLRKHIRILEEFLKNGEEYAEYEEYLGLINIMNGLQGDMDEIQTDKFCDNEVLNAICQIKQREAVHEEIPFDVEITYKDISWIDDFHLTSIIMNLLDNSFEAQKRLGPEEKKQVILRLTEKTDGSIGIFVENTIANGENIDFRTKKADAFCHGLGLDIASEYAAIYHGKIANRFDKENNHLTVWTELYPPEGWQKEDSVRRMEMEGN